MDKGRASVYTADGILFCCPQGGLLHLICLAVLLLGDLFQYPFAYISLLCLFVMIRAESDQVIIV